MEKNTILTDRQALVRLIEPIAKQFDSTVEWRGEDTVLKSSAFGGITGWLNREVFKEKPRSYEYQLGMPLRQLLDQLYVPA